MILSNNIARKFINETNSLLYMKINVSYDREKRKGQMELDDQTNVQTLLKTMEINPVTVIVSRNGEMILEEEQLNDGDSVKIFSVISGG